MKEITALDITFIVRELKTLENAIVEKIFHPTKAEMILQLHSAARGKKLLKIIAGKGIFLTKEKPLGEAIEKPSSFCMFLRKQLKQTRIKNVVQPGLERIVELQFTNDLKLILEVFSKGNIILCDKNYKILESLERQKWKDRTIKKGNTYQYPPAMTDPFTLSEEEFAERYNKSNKESVVKILAIDFSLGGKYAEEICLAAKVDKKKKRVNTSKICKEMKNLKNRPLKPFLTVEGNEIREFSPVELKIYKDTEKKYLPSCSEALEELFQAVSGDTRDEKEEKQRLVSLAKRQERQVEELKRKSEDYRKIGDLIYNNFTEIEKIIREIKATNWNVQHPMIKELNKKEGKVTLEL